VLRPRNNRGPTATISNAFRQVFPTSGNAAPRSRGARRPGVGIEFARQKEERRRPSRERAQARPGARCTRGLMCQDALSKTHMSIQVQRKQSGLPCSMVLRLISRSPRRDRACLSPSPCGCKRIATRSGGYASTKLETNHGGVRTTRLRRTQLPRSSCAPVVCSQPESDLPALGDNVSSLHPL
jgi:hypothetical protein